MAFCITNSLRIFILSFSFSIAFVQSVVGQNGSYGPDQPIWGIYATGNGYVVNSTAMAERAEYEGISIECFKTFSIAVMPTALIPPDSPSTYWLARNIEAGLVETKTDGLTWWEAQQELGIYSPYRNSDINCLSGQSSQPMLSGAWRCTANCPAGGEGKLAHISQASSDEFDVVLTNEGGGTTPATVAGSRIIAERWLHAGRKLEGTLSNSSRQIRWSNGTVWVKE